jgi:hypothetical protein
MGTAPRKIHLQTNFDAAESPTNAGDEVGQQREALRFGDRTILLRCLCRASHVRVSQLAEHYGGVTWQWLVVTADLDRETAI